VYQKALFDHAPKYSDCLLFQVEDIGLK
jgi:hypothetical protein